MHCGGPTGIIDPISKVLEQIVWVAPLHLETRQIMTRRSISSELKRRFARIRRSRLYMPSVLAAMLWVAVWGSIVVVADWHDLYWPWLIAGTLITFAYFWYDKKHAKRAAKRIPEKVLLSMVLIGGVLGGWVGMLLLRHKTLHSHFWLTQWIASALHAGCVWWLLT